MQYVVLMVTEGNFVTSDLLCQSEDLVSSAFGAKDTRGMSMIGGGIERGGEHMEFHASFGAEGFQVLCVTLVGDVKHPNVYSADSDAWSVYLLSSGHELREQKGVFAARQGDKYMVSVRQ